LFHPSSDVQGEESCVKYLASIKKKKMSWFCWVWGSVFLCTWRSLGGWKFKWLFQKCF